MKRASTAVFRSGSCLCTLMASDFGRVVLWWVSQEAQQVYKWRMRSTTWILYKVFAMGMVGLLLWNNANLSSMPEFHIAIFCHRNTEIRARLVSCHARRQNMTTAWRNWCSGCSATNQSTSLCRISNTTDAALTHMKNFAPWLFQSVSSSKIAAPFTGRSRQPWAILWTAASKATNSAWCLFKD